MTLYTSKVVAEYLGLSERRIRQLRDEGIIQERKPGLYELKTTMLRYCQYLRKGAEKTNLNDERALLVKAKREAAEMENEIRKGTLHNTEDIELGLKTLILNIRSKFLVMPSKLSPALASAGGNQTEIFNILKNEIDENLKELSDYRTVLVSQEEENEEN